MTSQQKREKIALLVVVGCWVMDLRGERVESIVWRMIQCDMVAAMKAQLAEVQPIRVADLWTVSQLVFANMTGVDQQFTAMNRNRLMRWYNQVTIPFYLLTAGRGFKVVRGGQMAGFAFVSLRPRSGYIFNVVVDHPFRRQGVGHTLMTYLEQEIRRKGRSWAVLQVDAGNEPAQNLYLRLGYQPYHPSFWQWKGDHWPKPLVHSDAWLAPARGRGRALYHYYADLNREVGDGWAARLISGEYPMPRPLGGEEWRCIWEGQEVGYAWGTTGEKGAVLILMLHPEGWGQPVWLLSYVQLMLEELGWRRGLVDVHLGSSEHVAAAADSLLSFGFIPCHQPRMLMVKHLLGE